MPLTRPPWDDGLSVSRLSRSSTQSAGRLLADRDLADRLWYVRDADGFDDLLKSWNADKRQICLVIHADSGDVVAFGRLQLSRPDRHRHVASIGPVVVRPSHQRRGIGAELLQNLLSIGRSVGAWRFEASFPADAVDLQRFFGSQGFSFECRRASAFTTSDGGIVDLEDWVSIQPIGRTR